MITAEKIVAQLKEEQERYDQGDVTARPALDLAREYGYVLVPIPSKDEWTHKNVLALVGYYDELPGLPITGNGTPKKSDGSHQAPREGTTTTTFDRYANRRVDLAARLQEPRRPTPWRCSDFVADGTLTLLASQSGDGKSWLGLALAVGGQNLYDQGPVGNTGWQARVYNFDTDPVSGDPIGHNFIIYVICAPAAAVS